MKWSQYAQQHSANFWKNFLQNEDFMQGTFDMSQFGIDNSKLGEFKDVTKGNVEEFMNNMFNSDQAKSFMSSFFGSNSNQSNSSGNKQKQTNHSKSNGKNRTGRVISTNDEREIPLHINENNEQLFPKVDTYRTKESLIVLIELPGLHKEDIKLLAKNDSLEISGNRNEHFTHYRPVSQEIFYGAFKKKITLPNNVDIHHSTAKISNGLLKVTFPYTMRK